MRSALLVVATFVLVICGFVIYSQMQRPTTPRAQPAIVKGPASVPAGAGSRGGSTTQPMVGIGHNPWVIRFDQRGELASRFRADRYEPQSDGTVLVDKPVAEFMLSGGRLIRIEGHHGSVIMPPPPTGAERGKLEATPTTPPNRGQLHDVVISLFDAEPIEGETARPSLTVTMNNASFDNDTFLIRTEAFDDVKTGARVAGDQVPVQVRGDDYDFDGRGLTIQWNDLDQQLQLMEIAHGESLTVKNPQSLEDMAGMSNIPAPSAEPTASQPAAAKARRKKKAPAAVATTAPSTPRPPAPYRASFERDLRISQGDVEMATGDLMQVDFVLDKSDDDDPAPATAPAAGNGAAPRRKRAKRPAATQSLLVSTTQPNAAKPIVVRWSGRLRVMPLDPSSDVALQPDEQIVRLSGTPLKLLRDGANIAAAGATYRSSDGSVHLRSSDEVPRVTLRDAKGAVISTPAISYSEDRETATFTGPSTAEIPMGADDAKETLSASWNDEAVFALPKNERGEGIIRDAKMKGAVAIAHPRMDLNTDELELAFATPTRPATQPADGSSDTPELERLIASGSVLARLKDGTEATRSIQSRRLEMQTAAAPNGTLIPRTIVADGEVLLSEPTQSLRADRLRAMLAAKPTTAPSSDGASPTTAPTTRKASDMPELIIESVVAQGAVRLSGEKGASASAEQLDAIEKDGQSLIKLMGVPTAPATVTDGRNTITGNILTLMPREEKAEVPGPGTLAFIHVDKEGKESPPVNVAWSGHASIDGKTNRVDLNQGVSFTTIDKEGTTTTSKSDHLQLVLADKPTTQPAAQSTTAPATRPAHAGLGDLRGMDFLSNKEPRSAKLDGDVRIESTLLGAEGAVARRMYLRAAEANYDMESRQMVIPVAGRLLYEDHRAPRPPKEGEEPDNTNRGTTAFLWKKRLTYDDADQRVIMEGDVEINHVPDDQKSPAFHIATQRVIAELMPKPTTAPATTVPAIAPTGPVPTAMQLKRVTAEGGVSVSTQRFQFTATTLSYNPIDGVLTARGTEDQPMTFTDEQGQGEGSIESLTWNTKTDQISLKRGRGRLRP